MQRCRKEVLVDIHQIVLTAQRDRRFPLFTKTKHHLEALHRIGRVCKGNLVLFALIAEHLHLIAQLSRAAAGRLAQSVLLTLRPLVKTPLASSYIKEVEGPGHMYRSVRYELEQPKKHGMPGHPALWPGSCLPELVGARVIPGLTLRIKEAEPTFKVERALKILRLPGEKVQPAGRRQLRSAGAARIVAATAAAFGVEPTLEGNRPHVRIARRAVAYIADKIGLPTADIKVVTGLDEHSLWRLRRREVSDTCIDAIRRRVTLEDLVSQVTMGTNCP
jgi:hypothetical protein